MDKTDFENLYGMLESDYDGYFSDTSRTNEIISEAKEKLLDLLTDEVKGMLEHLKEAKSEEADIDRHIREKEMQLKGIEKRVSDALEDADKAEKRDIPQRYISKFVHDATGGVAPGDTVYCLEPHRNTKICPMCNGNKVVSALVGKEEATINCPKCKGRGYMESYTYTVEEKEVSEVRLKLCFEKNRANYWNTDSVFLRGREYSVSPDNFWLTKEAAEEALRQREIVAEEADT